MHYVAVKCVINMVTTSKLCELSQKSKEKSIYYLALLFNDLSLDSEFVCIGLRHSCEQEHFSFSNMYGLEVLLASWPV